MQCDAASAASAASAAYLPTSLSRVRYNPGRDNNRCIYVADSNYRSSL